MYSVMLYLLVVYVLDIESSLGIKRLSSSSIIHQVYRSDFIVVKELFVQRISDQAAIGVYMDVDLSNYACTLQLSNIISTSTNTIDAECSNNHSQILLRAYWISTFFLVIFGEWKQLIETIGKSFCNKQPHRFKR